MNAELGMRNAERKKEDRVLNGELMECGMRNAERKKEDRRWECGIGNAELGMRNAERVIRRRA